MAVFRSDKNALLARIRALETELANRPSMAEVKHLREQFCTVLRERDELRAMLVKRDETRESIPSSTKKSCKELLLQPNGFTPLGGLLIVTVVLSLFSVLLSVY
jgi:hypothetical protein